MFKHILFCLIIFIVIDFALSIDDDDFLDTLSLIKKYGYEGEEHEVETVDGYLLTMHRILPKGSETAGKSPVLLQHGFLCSSSEWVILGPNFSLGYLLADAGYDVWLGNNRGNKYSQKHMVINPEKDPDKFWNFSWHQLGVYDLPAEIDYILWETNQESLFYAGHSQGTTQFFVMGSKKPEYNKKVKLMGAFAPLAYMGNARSPIFHLPESLFFYFGTNKLTPNSEFVNQVVQLCHEEIPLFICTNVFLFASGYDMSHFNQTKLSVILGHISEGASTKQIVHYAQNSIETQGFFREYDFGLKNFEIYGQMIPPEYHLANVDAPVALFYSSNDLMAAEKDVIQLRGGLNSLPNVVFTKKISAEDGTGYNHPDYLWATDSPTKVSALFIQLIKEYQ